MINKEKIIMNEFVYWTCQYTGAVKVKILEILDDDKVLVDTVIKRQAPITRDLKFIFNKEEHARVAKKDWEHAEKKAKKEERASSKTEKKAKKHQMVVDKVHSVVDTIKSKGIAGCFVQVTKGTEIWGKEALIEFGFEDDSIEIITLENGNVVFIDGGQSKYVIDIENVASVKGISKNLNDMVKCKNQFSFTTRDNNRVRIYFDYK